MTCAILQLSLVAMALCGLTPQSDAVRLSFRGAGRLRQYSIEITQSLYMISLVAYPADGGVAPTDDPKGGRRS